MLHKAATKSFEKILLKQESKSYGIGLSGRILKIFQSK
jgi:hypothetical protein